MTKNTEGPPDYDALAAKYLDLWQDQITKLAKDPQKLTDAATEWSRAATAMMQNAAAAMSEDSTPHDAKGTSASSPAAAGTEASGSAHGDRGLDSADILRRLDAIEKRVAALESDSTQSTSGHRGRSKRTKD